MKSRTKTKPITNRQSTKIMEAKEIKALSSTNQRLEIKAPVFFIDVEMVSEDQIKALVARCQPVIIRFSGRALMKYQRKIECAIL